MKTNRSNRSQLASLHAEAGELVALATRLQSIDRERANPVLAGSSISSRWAGDRLRVLAFTPGGAGEFCCGLPNGVRIRIWPDYRESHVCYEWRAYSEWLTEVAYGWERDQVCAISAAIQALESKAIDTSDFPVLDPSFTAREAFERHAQN